VLRFHTPPSSRLVGREGDRKERKGRATEQRKGV
jgi:hypothetical protein